MWFRNYMMYSTGQLPLSSSITLEKEWVMLGVNAHPLPTMRCLWHI